MLCGTAVRVWRGAGGGGGGDKCICLRTPEGRNPTLYLCICLSPQSKKPVAHLLLGSSAAKRFWRMCALVHILSGREKLASPTTHYSGQSSRAKYNSPIFCSLPLKRTGSKGLGLHNYSVSNRKHNATVAPLIGLSELSSPKDQLIFTAITSWSAYIHTTSMSTYKMPP